VANTPGAPGWGEDESELGGSFGVIPIGEARRLRAARPESIDASAGAVLQGTGEVRSDAAWHDTGAGRRDSSRLSAARATADSEDSASSQVAQQLRRWREHLLDLTRGNPLLGINRARTSKLKVTAPTPNGLFDALVVQGKKLRMPLVERRPVPAETDPNASEPASPWLVRPGDVAFDAEPGDLYRRLRRVRDNARTTVEERGVTTLHLGIATLEWEDPYLGRSIAPIWLIPCAFETTSVDGPLLLVATDEDPLLNPALALYLRERHKRALPDLPEELGAGIIAQLTQEARQTLGDNWLVADEAWLSTFSFETLTIYQDLGRLAEAAESNEIVRAFSGVAVERDPAASERLGDDLDALPSPAVVPISALPADSSQLEALTYARAGQHVLVHGPPGTGKSQTIANLIADALAQRKTVLFVSAKMAALEVVFDRLARLGLDRYCLEAHSTKAGKARVIDELRRTLSVAEQTRPTDYQTTLRRYLALRESLNQGVRELHRQREPVGRSVFDALSVFAHLESLPALAFPLPWPDVTKVTLEQVDEAVDLLRELQAQAAIFAERETHPWRGCKAREASYATREVLIEALAAFERAAIAILDAAPLLEPFFGPLGGRSLHDLERTEDAFRALAGLTWLPSGWSEQSSGQLAETAEVLKEAAEKTRHLRELQARFAERTDDGDPVASRELLALARDRFNNFFKRWLPAYGAWMREVQATVRPKADSHSALLELAELAQDISAATVWLDVHQAALAAARPPGTSRPLDERALVDAAEAFWLASRIQRGREDLRVGGDVTLAGPVGIEVQGAAGTVLRQLPSADPALAGTLGQFAGIWGGPFLERWQLADAPLAAALVRCREALAAESRLLKWLRFQQTLERCQAAGLGPFLDALAPHGAERATGLFLRRYLLLWIDRHVAQTEALQSFSGVARAALVQEFQTLDRLLQAAAAAEARSVAASRAAQINETDQVSRSSQIGILRRELEKKRRARPLRRLFAEIPQVLQALKPCMLMSPVSVSTYLTPGTISFDVVVFDEASQLPPQEAIPSILRARQVVVAGDDKQLPPTSFFASSLFLEEDEDDDQADGRPLESLLSDCKAMVGLFREAHLRWHYRSRDERLIAFSNHQFYEGGLITFPTPGSPPDRGVHLHFVSDGVWDRGKSRTNRPEARAVVEIIIRELEAHPERSMGVVALSVTQKEAIEDALEEKLADRPDLKARLYPPDDSPAAKEPFFIKSLENVQGDERDTIIISVGYARDPSGTLALNFGPINREGGWRRLNVLVTRAKYLTVLVTSLQSAQLRAVPESNRGATALREFIAYAERGARLAPEAARLTGAETNDFEDAIAAALRARGLLVDEQVGASSFRIDLAVRDPRDPNWYILGIECDGATYHSSRAARDRDLLRAEMLRGMGWRLYRIWSVDWFRNPEAEIDAAVEAVERAMRLGDPDAGVAVPNATPAASDLPPAGLMPDAVLLPPAAVSAPVPPPAPAGPQFPPGIPYHRATGGYPNRSLLIDSDERHRLATEIIRIVDVEAPIHPEVVLERLKELHDVRRAGNNVRANFKTALAAALKTRRVSRDSAGFLWVPDRPITHFRVPPDGTNSCAIEYIPMEEMRLAVLHLVEAQFGLPKAELVRETARLFGFARTSADMTDYITNVVDDLIESGELRLSGFQVSLGDVKG